QHLDDARRADATIHVDRQTLLGELVRDGEALELLAVGAMIEHEVVGPHLVRPARRLRPRPRRCDALPRPLARQLQARRSPLSLPKTEIRAYRWCSPPRIGCAMMSPNGSTGRVQGASFPSARWVRTSL